MEAAVAVESEEVDWSLFWARSKLTQKQVAEKICHTPYGSQKKRRNDISRRKENAI